MNANHWTQDLKAENAALRAILADAILALGTIGQSRLDKERTFPHQDPNDGLVYTTCAREVTHLCDAARSQAMDRLAELGITL